MCHICRTIAVSKPLPGWQSEAIEALQKRAGELRHLYRTGMRLEAAFFSGQPGLSALPPLGILVVDFDETCTADDSTAVIINAAIAAAEQRAGGATNYNP